TIMRQTDGRAITNPENAQSFSHAEIKQAADAMNPAALDGAFAAWSAIAAAVTNAGQRFEDAIKNAVEQHWEGAAADSAVRGVREYAARVGELGEAIGAQSLPLSAAADAAAKFKMSVPELLDAAGATADPAQRNSREEQARDEMNTQYIQPYGATAPGIPTLPPPVAPAAAVPTGVEPGTGSGTDPGSGTGSGTGTGVETGTTVDSQAVAATRSTDNSSSGDAPSTADTTSPAGSADDGEPEDQAQPTAEGTPQTMPSQAVTSTQDTAATTPASIATTQTATPYAPIVPSSPPQTAPTAVIPTSFGSSPSGTPSGPGAPGAAGTPSAPDNQARPGTSRPAQPTVPAAANGQPTAPVRAGATGAAGYSGMVPPGLRGRRTDDDEHKSPKYLRTEEHAKELLGEVKPTVPPVLGEQ
ncbi:hypothetical protein, partial [Nocardia araoensis]|uniref:hypothetical protein n=1 Tax=Nocardia araoensis TaxID=228600 RepID=UPI001C3F2B10